MSTEFDPKKIIDFSKDYYEILNISKNELPQGNSRDDKVHLSKILETAFRKRARVCHPDFGGSNEAFLDIVRARRILEDPMLKKIYDQGYFEEFNVNNVGLGLEVDWTKIGTYRKGTPEDTIGFNIFLKLCDKKEDLALIPAFFPQSNEHNYEWDWVLGDSKTKLALSIVNDESEVLRLTSGADVNDSLPFKIYLCIPRANLVLKRDNQEVLSPFGKTMVNGYIQRASYSDITFLETTRLDKAMEYIENEFEKDLSDYRDGKNLEKFLDSKISSTKWMNSDEMKKYDNNMLSEILNMRAYVIEENKNAADFLDNLPE
jgi:curved DNA-binding protein CbpA